MTGFEIYIVIGSIFLFLLGMVIMAARWYRKTSQGQALVRTGQGGTRVAFDKGIFVIPVLHLVEQMDLSVKKVEIARLKEDGLICRDNLRADIKVAFFVRVNQAKQDIIKVAQTIGCARASDPETLHNLFEAKFSEALKTVGKRFDFVELYDNREKFKKEIMNTIGEDLNGYVLDDCAIDYLEQTRIEFLSIDNILDSEGIKKITELTAAQKVKANFIRREEEKTIKEQDVEAREAILEYERQLAEKEQRQRREIANITAKEEAEIAKIREEERLRADMVRIQTEEKLRVAEEQMQRQVIVAAKNKERTEAVENERVEKDRLLEQTERERIVTLAEIEKERAIEEERKNIQDVIRDRVMVEKKTVEEEEKIKDTREIAAANRSKQVAIIGAEEVGEANLIETLKAAEAEKQAAEVAAQKRMIDAEAEMSAAEKEAEARKIIAEAKAAEEATLGVSEAQVIEAKAAAREQEGLIEAKIIEQKAIAEARGMEAKAEAIRKQGSAEAKVMEEKLAAEAKGVEQKAEAMKKLDGVGKEHEEFKLKLEKEKEVELAKVRTQKEIAEAQAMVLAEAYKHANIDIVGGDSSFVNGVLNAVGNGKMIDSYVNHSNVLGQFSDKLLNGASNGNGGGLFSQIQQLINRLGLSRKDLQNITIATLLLKLQDQSSGKERDAIQTLAKRIDELGLGDNSVGDLL